MWHQWFNRSFKKLREYLFVRKENKSSVHLGYRSIDKQPHNWSVFKGLSFVYFWILTVAFYFGFGPFQHDFKGHSPLDGHIEHADHF